MEGLDSRAVARWIKLMRLGQFLGCHQKQERSFFVKGYQFPICARCTGVFVGEAISIALVAAGIRLHYLIVFILIAVMGIDWLIQEIKILESTNFRRFVTGICGGVGVTFVYYAVINFFYNTIRAL